MKPMNEELKVTIDQVLHPQPKKLPDELSALIRVAVADAKLVEQDPRYKLDMTKWHTPLPNDETEKAVCNVCLAGCVVAKSLGISPDQHFEPGSSNTPLRQKLYALDSVRVGEATAAVVNMYLGGRFTELVGLRKAGSLGRIDRKYQRFVHETKRRISWGNMLNMADELEELGY